MKKAILIFCMLIISHIPLLADWSCNNSIGIYSGSDSTNQSSNIYYLNTGIRFIDSSWNISAYIQLINQNGSSNQTGSNSGGMMGGSNMSIGLGDIYIYPEYFILKDTLGNPVLTVSGSLKLPTASSSGGYGRGYIDEGLNLNYYKQFSTYLLLLNLGFVHYGGNIDGNSYSLAYGIGIGKFFFNGNLSALLSLSMNNQNKNFSIHDNDLSLGLNYRAGKQIILSGIISAGLSDSFNYKIFSLGINYNFSKNMEN